MQISLSKHDVVDSTSTLAMQQLRSGATEPFAIYAKQQTAGRGRMGHQWQSTGDGLYLSIALPAAYFTKLDPSLLSLRAAVLIADWLRQHLKFRATLKWPNDLLFGGAKFGGILCESDFQGNTAKGLVIGLGINLSHAPDLPELRTTYLKAITGRTYYPEDLARSVVEFFASHWLRDADQEVVKHYQQFAIDSGQPWRSADGAVVQLQGYSADGTLLLKSPGGAEARITSAQSPGAWVYQTRQPQPLVVADVGNSLTKLALYLDVADEQPTTVFAPGDALGLDGCLAEVTKALAAKGFKLGSYALYIGSVNPAAAELLRLRAAEHGIPACMISKRGVFRLQQSSYSLIELGIDRLAAIEAVLAEVRASESALRDDQYHVVACAGTATTIDVVRSDGLHLGGRIIPGMQLALDSMGQRAAQLPGQLKVPVLAESEIADNRHLLGHSTIAAMQFGVVAMTLTSITDLIGSLTSESTMQESPILHLCGGLAAALGSIPDAQIDPNLVLKGLKLLAVGGLSRRT